jgi:hypothetical protein
MLNWIGEILFIALSGLIIYWHLVVAQEGINSSKHVEAPVKRKLKKPVIATNNTQIEAIKEVIEWVK